VDDVRVNARVVIPGREIHTAFARSRGPGGQNVNKVESKVELRWRPADSAALSGADRAWLLARLARRLTAGGELIVTSERLRDQVRNRADAAAKLARIVADALRRPKPRRPTRPGKAAERRRLDAKRRHSQRKRQRSAAPEE
jgi:ribosome-associated protein